MSNCKKERVKREVEALHVFFEGWLGGTLPEGEETFRCLEDALGEGFILVNPDGAEIDRPTLMKKLRSAHGLRPAVHIWIENVRVLLDEGALVVARYEECQAAGSAPRPVDRDTVPDSPPGRDSSLVGDLSRVDGDTPSSGDLPLERDSPPVVGATRRLSTAVFHEAADARNGLKWLHVHETWVGE